MSFKRYINEAFKITELMSMGAIPLTVGMMNRLGYSENEKTVYHLMHSKALNQRYKQQKSEYHLSTFSKGSKKLSGLPSQPNMLLRLKGLSLIEADVDIYTEPSNKKRRWITSQNSKLQKNMEGVLLSALREVSIIIDGQIKHWDIRKQIVQNIQKLNKKDSKKLYKSYISKTENWLNSGGYKVLNDYLKNASNVSYNEIVLTRWTIEEVMDINIIQPETVKFCEKTELNYGGVTDWDNIIKIDIS